MDGSIVKTCFVGPYTVPLDAAGDAKKTVALLLATKRPNTTSIHMK